MALLRRGHQLMLTMTSRSSIRCFRSAPALLTGTQNEFTGLENCFIWDDKHGFGYNKNGDVVIVTPNTHYPSTNPVFNSENINVTSSPDLEEQIPEPQDGQINQA
ncbi:hypothetical protein OS493_029967 [Desmophyllum pertusum]|uniref:Uncharacterized protein n=1 Tax=Desmophyllum pertusum TaxID=174260 RepID=A0A9W9ZXD9_9CNID|nr:hypothetical protein OS493_029967 [Desmophyllum pertusum]